MHYDIWTKLAINKELDGNDLRIVLICRLHNRTQKDICELLNIKKSNVSQKVNRLISMGVLIREKRDNIYSYKNNLEW